MSEENQGPEALRALMATFPDPDTILSMMAEPSQDEYVASHQVRPQTLEGLLRDAGNQEGIVLVQVQVFGWDSSRWQALDVTTFIRNHKLMRQLVKPLKEHQLVLLVLRTRPSSYDTEGSFGLQPGRCYDVYIYRRP